MPMNEIDLLIQNATLRDELEPYYDDSLCAVDLEHMSTQSENQYLQSLLAWERAPVLPISQWFEPELCMAPMEHLDDDTLHSQLHQVIGRLYEKNIELECTGHLSDRQLYGLIMRDILPSQEKRLGLSDAVLRWQCLDPIQDEESWLRFYATPDERSEWAAQTGLRLPPRERLPFSRRMPQDG